MWTTFSTGKAQIFVNKIVLALGTCREVISIYDSNDLLLKSGFIINFKRPSLGFRPKLNSYIISLHFETFTPIIKIADQPKINNQGENQNFSTIFRWVCAAPTYSSHILKLFWFQKIQICDILYECLIWIFMALILCFNYWFKVL